MLAQGAAAHRACPPDGGGPVSPDLRTALRTVALAIPAGTPINFTLLREDLLELVDGEGSRPLVATDTPPPADRLLKAREAAAILNVSPRYIYAHRRDYPFTKNLPGGLVRFSERGLGRYLGRV